MAVFPSTDTWVTPRTTEIKIDSKNCMVIVQQKIADITRVLVKADGLSVRILTSMTDPDGVNRQLTEYYTAPNDNARLQYLDITDYVVEQAKYDTLRITKPVSEGNVVRELSVNNAQYYIREQNILYIQNQTIKTHPLDDWFKNVTVWNMTIAVAFDKLLRQGLYTKPLGEFQPATGFVAQVHKMTNNPMSALFRIYYTPLGESVNLQVVKTNPQPTKFRIPFSQQQPIVDNVTHGRQMQSLTNRTGCETKEVVRTLHSLAERRKLGTIYRERDENGKLTGNVWRLTGQKYEIWSDTFIRVVETWSKNWAYRSPNAPINRQFRSWNIPADIVQRNLSRNDYCLLTRRQDVTLPDDAWISEDAKAALMRGLTGVKIASQKGTECTNMWFYTKNGNDRQGVILNCSAFGFGNSLVFSGKTKDNLSAGMQRVQSDDSDSNYQFCKDVYYCNENGKLDTLFLQIGAEVFSDESLDNPNLEANLYPEFYSTMEKGTQNGFGAPDQLYLFKTDTSHRVLKDPSEQLNFTYQLHLLTDDGYLVIGATWAETNPLVRQRTEDQQIKVWKLTQCVPQGAQIMTPTYGTELQSNLFSVVYSGGDGASVTFNGAVNDGVGVCVTDAQNNVLIAFNSAEKAMFRVLFTHSYDEIAKVLRAR